MASHEVKTRADLLRLIDRAADEEWTELDLAGLGLEELPGEIGKLERLERLILGKWVDGEGKVGNKLTTLPAELFQLQSLQSIELSYNYISETPDAITKLRGLQILSLVGNQISDIPNAITNLQRLKILELSSNQISEIPEAISNLHSLQTLELSSNQISETPEAITNLHSLQTLELSSNQISEIPEAITNLQSLQTLGLSSNKISEIPEAITNLYSLQTLRLNSNQISEIPEAIANLQSLQTLELNSNQIPEIPEAIAKLQSLQTLELGSNQISEIPQEIAKLQELKNLSLGRNQISGIPKVITKLQNLQTLELSSSQISEIPEEIAKLKELKNLILFENQITKIPDELVKLQELQNIDLGGNQITEITETLTKLQGLHTLSLNSNQITEIPETISQLRELQTLNLGGNQITKISEALAKLQELQALYLNSNQITEIPEALTQLAKLRDLYLLYNQIAEIPEKISKLNSLRRLDLDSNKLTIIPEAITSLQSLQFLDLRSNQISEIPQSINNLEELKILFLQRNLISEIPDELADIQGLQSIFLGENQIGKVPEAAAKLDQLQILDLNSNRISVLPIWMKGCQLKFSLDLTGNPISIPLEILIDKNRFGRPQANKLSNLASFYFQTQDPNESKPLQEAKLLIIGEGGAGKTTLAKKIDNVNYELKLEDSDNPEKSTEGIEVKRWEFPHTNDSPFRVNVWDFGGQEVYHATHQFFLTNRSCYALVIDSRGDFSAASFYYWLNVVRLLGGDSPVFIVKNEKQDRQCEINEGQLRAEFPNLEKSVCVNFATNRGLDDLKANLQKHITALPEIDKPWPNSWVRIRNALENYSVNYIDLAEYLDLCRTNGITHKSEALQISSLLHELGICLHFQSDLGLKNYVILSPTWATNAVYKVTDNQKVKDDLGRFSETDLNEIWSDSQYTDVKDELLALMQKFAICYPLRDRPGSYIAPSLLSIDRPNYNWDNSDNLILRYEYEFMPKGLITRLIVEMHELIEPCPHPPSPLLPTSGYRVHTSRV